MVTSRTRRFIRLWSSTGSDDATTQNNTLWPLTAVKTSTPSQCLLQLPYPARSADLTMRPDSTSTLFFWKNSCPSGKLRFVFSDAFQSSVALLWKVPWMTDLYWKRLEDSLNGRQAHSKASVCKGRYKTPRKIKDTHQCHELVPNPDPNVTGLTLCGNCDQLMLILLGFLFSHSGRNWPQRKNNNYREKINDVKL